MTICHTPTRATINYREWIGLPGQSAGGWYVEDADGNILINRVYACAEAAIMAAALAGFEPLEEGR